MTIKYCIWDVGKTIYDYSLTPLNDMLRARTTDTVAFDGKKGVYRYDFDPYMKGDVGFLSVCRDLCEEYKVNYTDDIPARVNKALHEGVGEYYPETKKAMLDMKNAGIGNCILSNALPILADTGNVFGLVDKKNIFCSYSLGMLKPDPAIYQCVVSLLEANPDEILYIDDKSKNTEAAAKLGFNTITYDRKTLATEIRRYVPALCLPMHNRANGNCL